SYAFTVEEGRATVEGKYQKGRPAWFKADRVEFFQQGKALAYKQGEKWQKSKTGVESDPLIVLSASAKVREARLPHEELAAFEKHLTNVTRAEEKKQTVYAGDLTAAGARALAKPADRDVARGGTAKVWVDGKGRVVKYQVTIELKGRRGNADVDGDVAKTVT